MKRLSIICLLVLTVSACHAQNPSESVVPAAADTTEAINQVPMYGHRPKTARQLAADARFIEEVTQQFGSRSAASVAHTQWGWNYIRQGNLKTAMARFNQAWLLDSTNVGAFWGFGVIRGHQQQFDEAVELLTTATVMDSTRSALYTDLATAYQDRYAAQHNSIDLTKSLDALNRAIELDPTNAKSFAQKAFALYYLQQFDAANDAVNRALQLDPQSVPPNFIGAIRDSSGN